MPGKVGDGRIRIPRGWLGPIAAIVAAPVIAIATLAIEWFVVWGSSIGSPAEVWGAISADARDRLVITTATWLVLTCALTIFLVHRAAPQVRALPRIDLVAMVAEYALLAFAGSVFFSVGDYVTIDVALLRLIDPALTRGALTIAVFASAVGALLAALAILVARRIRKYRRLSALFEK